MQNSFTPFFYNVPSSSLEGGSSSDVTNNQMSGNSMINGSDKNHHPYMNIDREHHHSNPNHDYVSTPDIRYSSSQPLVMVTSAPMSSSTVTNITGGMSRRMSASMPTTRTTSTNSACTNMLSPPIDSGIEQHFYRPHNNNSSNNKNNNVDDKNSISSSWGKNVIEPIPLACTPSTPYAPFPTTITSTTATATATATATSSMKSQQQQGMTAQYQQGKFDVTREKNQLSQLPHIQLHHEQKTISQKEERQKFLVFVYILFKYIDEAAKMQTFTKNNDTTANKSNEHFRNKNKALKIEARQVMKECTNGCRLGIKGYSPLVNAIQSKLRIIPNIDSHWDLASKHCHFFWLKRKRRDKCKGKNPMNKRNRNTAISTNPTNTTNDKDKQSKMNWGDTVSYKKRGNIDHGTMDSTTGGERERSNNNINVKLSRPNTSDDDTDYMEVVSKIEFI